MADAREVNRIRDIAPEGVFVCETCGAQFATKEEAEEHQCDERIVAEREHLMSMVVLAPPAAIAAERPAEQHVSPMTADTSTDTEDESV